MRDRNPGINLGRRRALVLAAGAAASVIHGGRGLRAAGLMRALEDDEASEAIGACVVRPQQTEGPYFVDERLNRSDIRGDPAAGSPRPGLPLQLALRVSRLSGASCAPLEKAVVDVWQCDALGVYSDVVDDRLGFDTRGAKFLRGYQLTDDAGVARFTTIYPGWYPGRAVHIHFKIRTQATARAREFTSQVYFDEAVTDRVHAEAPYHKPGRRRLNAADGIYRRGGSGDRLQLALAAEGAGYAGTFDVALQD